VSPPTDPKSPHRTTPATPGKPAAAPTGPGTSGPGTTPAPAGDERPSGRVVHDDRGNAVWQWIEHTVKIAIDTTSHIWKKLEKPELKVEDTAEHELRIVDDVDPGGGYDPYNVKTNARKPSQQKAAPLKKK
jgi:hypothetical protein